MQINATSASSIASITNLKNKEGAGAIEPRTLTKSAQDAVDSFVTATSTASTQSAGLYRKPAATTPALSATPEESATKNAKDTGVTIEPSSDTAVTQQAEAAETPEPPSFGDKEFQQFLEAFGKKDGDEGFNAKMDVNGDGSIDGRDLSVVLANYRRVTT